MKVEITSAALRSLANRVEVLRKWYLKMGGPSDEAPKLLAVRVVGKRIVAEIGVEKKELRLVRERRSWRTL